MAHEDCSNRTDQHVLLLGGLSLSLVNFRGPLIQALLAKGYRVTAVAGNYDADIAQILSRWGASYVALPLSRSGMNPITDIASLVALISLMHRIRPNIFLGYTIKPVTLGLIAAKLAGIPRRYAMITGLGYAFTEGPETKRKIVRAIALILYRLSLRYAGMVIFQNSDDQLYFKRHVMGVTHASATVGGSGVDLGHYKPVPFIREPITVLMVARLLRDKGVLEFVQAARLVRQANNEVRFVLVGPLDPSPDAITSSQVQAWVEEGAIVYKGEIADIRPEIAACHVYVLPSYREGTPRTVLEAMAMGRPIVTTNAPGCRETIEPDCSNGILVPVRNAEAIADAITCLLALPPQRLEEMGKAGLRMVRDRFEVGKVTGDIMHALDLD